MHNGAFGFWAAQDGRQVPPTSPLDRDLDVDVGVVGGGYSGLWTAIALKEQAPPLRVAVFEADELGRGASGRNGGWLSAKPVGFRGVLARVGGREPVQLVERLLHEAIDDVVARMARHGIDIEAVHGGWLQVARSSTEEARLRAALAGYREWGVGEDDVAWLDAAQLAERLRVTRAVGALASPGCYRINPLKLLDGVATVARAAGVEVFTNSRVEDIRPGRLRVGGWNVTAGSVVIATEGYSAQQRGRRREVLPLNSVMIATAPQSPEVWERIGWQCHAGVSGAAHTYFYGQHTIDGRIILGGRGNPYRFASGVDERGEVDARTIRSLEAMLADLFPAADARADYAWCGVLGVVRDWSPLVEAKGNGVYEIGGYAGQGVTAAKIAGTAVAALITGADVPERRIPWIRSRPRKWEPEPLRWLGAHGLYRAYALADRHEARRGGTETSPIARIADRLTGRG